MGRYPILYSFRRCPYAIRARMAIYQADVKCELREVVLSDKPQSMLQLSNKGTVPVLLTTDEQVIDESLDVMFWALKHNDPDGWLDENHPLSQSLIEKNDNEFKYYLDRYKYHVGYPEHSQAYYRKKTFDFLDVLEDTLGQHDGVALLGKQLTLSDIAIFPFIRQFANVDLNWFESSPYEYIKQWYKRIGSSYLFQNCMNKYEKWLPEHEAIYFPV